MDPTFDLDQILNLGSQIAQYINNGNTQIFDNIDPEMKSLVVNLGEQSHDIITSSLGEGTQAFVSGIEKFKTEFPSIFATPEAQRLQEMFLTHFKDIINPTEPGAEVPTEPGAKVPTEPGAEVSTEPSSTVPSSDDIQPQITETINSILMLQKIFTDFHKLTEKLDNID